MPNHDGLFDTVVHVAEVKKKTSAGDTYKRNENITYPSGKRIINEQTNDTEETTIASSDMLFAIDVQYSLNGRLKFIENVKPYNANIKQIPIPGESVLIFQSFNHESNVDEYYTQWYYMAPMAPSSNINSNILPTVTEDIELDEKFEEENYKVSPLQPYRGDLMLEGRFGNSIRFSSTIDFKDDYSLAGNWGGGNNGDPILILSNGREYKENKQFVTENINTDKSSLYLTSTQKLNTLKLSKTLTKFGKFQGSQFVGVADRAIIRAKTEAAVIDADEAIILNTPGQILIGSDEAAQSMVHGEVLLGILQNILTQLTTVVQCGSASGRFINLSYVEEAQRQLRELLSSKYFINKNTY